jgi:hypothetical protein
MVVARITAAVTAESSRMAAEMADARIDIFEAYFDIRTRFPITQIGFNIR